MQKPDFSTIPVTAGVYFYRSSDKTPIYIGKAKNLRSRLQSYFDSGVEGKTLAMISEAETLDWVQVNSEFESILLEAELIRRYKPKYNIELKDDKSPLYIGITKEAFPRVITLRRTQIGEIPLSAIYGPFQSSMSTRRLLRLVRRVFPFSDHPLGQRACLYKELGLCDPCPNEITHETDPKLRADLAKAYKMHISHIKLLFRGKISVLVKTLERKMKAAAKLEDFETAKELREDISLLVFYTQKHESPERYIENPHFLSDIRQKELDHLHNLLSPYYPNLSLSRIECFDIAHVSGEYTTASMVTFIDGESDRRWYRHFKIKTVIGPDDFLSMKEVLSRRATHFDDWGKPNLIIVDGGKGQVSSVSDIIPSDISYVGLAKRLETLVVPYNGEFIELVVPPGPALTLVQRIRDEAHRFARRYHHKLVAKAIRSGNT